MDHLVRQLVCCCTLAPLQVRRLHVNQDNAVLIKGYAARPFLRADRQRIPETCDIAIDEHLNLRIDSDANILLQILHRLDAAVEQRLTECVITIVPVKRVSLIRQLLPLLTGIFHAKQLLVRPQLASRVIFDSPPELTSHTRRQIIGRQTPFVCCLHLFVWSKIRKLASDGRYSVDLDEERNLINLASSALCLQFKL